jgi:APA family basic amino acid/polyamine antiporter
MGRDRLLPQQLDYISKRFGTSWFSVVVAGIAIVAQAEIFYNNIAAIAAIVNFGSLFTYLFTHLPLIKLRKSEPDTKRVLKLPLHPVIPVIGSISCVLLIYYLDYSARVASIIWLAGGIAMYYYMTKSAYNTTSVRKK